MSKICFAVLMLVTVVARVSVADEPVPVMGAGTGMWGITDPRPSGLRFTGAEVSVRTANIEGIQGPGDCQACGHQLYCADWKLVPWFGAWDEPQSHGCGHCGAGCSTCGQ